MKGEAYRRFSAKERHDLMMFLKGIEGEGAGAGRSRKMGQEARSVIQEAWTRVITVEAERSCWNLDIF